MRTKKIAFCASLLLFFSMHLNAQQVKKQELLDAWKGMEDMVIGTAEAMPAEHYTWVPKEGFKSFGLLVSHHAQANYGFAPTIFGVPGLQNNFEWDENNKEEVIKVVKESFEFVRKAIEGLSQEDLDKEIEVFGAKQSRMKATLNLTAHLQREHGKAIVYARLKDIAPARSANW